jgi:DNA-directed RNA polymerase subunit M/transcription elongation factor TFIIS
VKPATRLSLKACPECKGDMYLDSDAYGTYWKCLQCGRLFELEARRTATSETGTDKLAFGDSADLLTPPIMASPSRATFRC